MAQSFRKPTLSITALIIGAISCGSPDAFDNANNEEIGTVSQGLDSAHARVINECSQAMSGSWWTYNETNWPTSVTYGWYAYASADLGAWSKLLDANYGCTTNSSGNCITPWTRGWWTSCRSTTTVQNYPPCSLSYGDLDTVSLYDSQGGYKHAGQCKSFMNLVAYRSGLYQNSGYAWKSFPNDTCIKYTTATCGLPPAQRVLRPTNDANMPMATYSNIIEGDYLRRPYGHALIIVRKVSDTQVVVLDTNYMNPNGGSGDGLEIIASHSMAFGSGDYNSNLGAYRVLKCAYTGAC